MSSPGTLALILPYLGDQITALFVDAEVTDIMVNGDGGVWVTRNGLNERVHVSIDQKNLRQAIVNVSTFCGGFISERDPRLSARLEDGSRVEAIFPPVSVGGPTLSIRRFPRLFTLADLYLNHMITYAQAQSIQAAISDRANILIAGGPGTGKSTLLRTIAAEMFPKCDRIVLIEDTAEITIDLPNVVRLEARKPSQTDPLMLPVHMHELVMSALRLNAARLVVGEVRGADAYALLQALNTGHRGSLTTLHANNARLALMRFAHCVMEAQQDMSYDLVREAIGAVIQLVVVLERDGAGHLSVVDLVHVNGFDIRTGAFSTVSDGGKRP